MGGLVQPPPAARAHRKRTAGRSRSALLRSEGGACPSRVIQAKTPPRNPERFSLYLPQEWADDPVRRKTAGVPEAITFQTKPEIALDQLRAAVGAGLPRGVVVMDAGYGSDTPLRTDITALGFRYIAGILSNTSVWAQGTAPLPPKPWSGRGRPPTPPAQAPAPAPSPRSAGAEITWRE